MSSASLCSDHCLRAMLLDWGPPGWVQWGHFFRWEQEEDSSCLLKTHNYTAGGLGTWSSREEPTPSQLIPQEQDQTNVCMGMCARYGMCAHVQQCVIVCTSVHACVACVCVCMYMHVRTCNCVHVRVNVYMCTRVCACM